MPLYRGSRGLVLMRRVVLQLSPPVVTYVSQSGTTGSSTTTITATGVNIGNPSYIGTRRVIVCIQGGGNSIHVTSGTINGVALDQMTAIGAGASGSNGVDFVSAPVPSGTTGITIVLNYSTAIFTSPSLTIYNVDTSLLSSITPVTAFNDNSGTSGLNTASLNSTTKAGGFMIAGVWAGGGAGPTITSSTETYTLDYSVSAWMSAHANGISSNVSNTVSTQAPPAGGNSGLGLAAWR